MYPIIKIKPFISDGFSLVMILLFFSLFFLTNTCGLQPNLEFKEKNIQIFPECKLFIPIQNPTRESKVNLMIQLRGIVPNIFNQAGVSCVILACDTNGLSSQMLAKFGMESFIPTVTERISSFLKVEYGNLTKIGRIGLGGFSAGYAPIQKHLKHDLDSVIIIDGIHYGPRGQPNPIEHKPFVDYAMRARDKGKLMIISHSSILPPYSSSTDAANYILKQIEAKRVNATQNREYRYPTRYGTIIQPNTRADSNGFHVEGYLGTTAQSHFEQLDHLANLWNFYLAKRWNC